MSEICLPRALVLTLLDEVGRSRALSDLESELIEDCLAIEQFRWNPRLDVALTAAAASKGGIARFSRRHGITSGMAYQRIYRLRRKGKAG